MRLFLSRKKSAPKHAKRRGVHVCLKGNARQQCGVPETSRQEFLNRRCFRACSFERAAMDDFLDSVGPMSKLQTFRTVRSHCAARPPACVLLPVATLAPACLLLLTRRCARSSAVQEEQQEDHGQHLDVVVDLARDTRLVGDANAGAQAVRAAAREARSRPSVCRGAGRAAQTGPAAREEHGARPACARDPRAR